MFIEHARIIGCKFVVIFFFQTIFHRINYFKLMLNLAVKCNLDEHNAHLNSLSHANHNSNLVKRLTTTKLNRPYRTHLATTIDSAIVLYKIQFPCPPLIR